MNSTLGSEAQAMATAGGTAEWLSLLLAEAVDGPFDPSQAQQVMSRRSPIYATDCKSLFDHLVSPSSPTSIDDRRTSIDVVIIRESLNVTSHQWFNPLASYKPYDSRRLDQGSCRPSRLVAFLRPQVFLPDLAGTDHLGSAGRRKKPSPTAERCISCQSTFRAKLVCWLFRSCLIEHGNVAILGRMDG